MSVYVIFKDALFGYLSPDSFLIHKIRTLTVKSNNKKEWYKNLKNKNLKFKTLLNLKEFNKEFYYCYSTWAHVNNM